MDPVQILNDRITEVSRRSDAHQQFCFWRTVLEMGVLLPLVGFLFSKVMGWI